jgi:hypothetical protein
MLEQALHEVIDEVSGLEYDPAGDKGHLYLHGH